MRNEKLFEDRVTHSPALPCRATHFCRANASTLSRTDERFACRNDPPGPGPALASPQDHVVPRGLSRPARGPPPPPRARPARPREMREQPFLMMMVVLCPGCACCCAWRAIGLEFVPFSRLVGGALCTSPTRQRGCWSGAGDGGITSARRIDAAGGFRRVDGA